MLMSFLFVIFSVISTGNLKAELFPSQNIVDSLETGDLILRTSATLDSMVLSRTTLGPYSHLGLIYRDNQGKLFVLETFPNKGLQVHEYEAFVNPRIGRTFRIRLLRFTGGQRQNLIDVIETFINNSQNIYFDMGLVMDEHIPTIDELKTNKKFDYYCVEMVDIAFQIAYGKNYLNPRI